MRSYHHFTLSERRCLVQMLQEGKSLRAAAQALHRSASSISRELRRNAEADQSYAPEMAVVYYFFRRRKCVRTPALLKSSDCLNYVERKLKRYWSPEGLVKRWHERHPEAYMVSVSTIYRAIHHNLVPHCAARTHLRRHGIPYKGNRSRFNTIHPDHTIAELPMEAINRLLIGHWEGDTIRGKNGTGGILSLVDRKSRLCILRLIPDMSAATLEQTIVQALKHLPRKTILLDNGSEFARHRQIARRLRTTIYFADPHAPWQRGSNENCNDRVRFFFPKGTDARTLTAKDVARIQFLLNNRPLKCLNWLTPSEAFHAKCCT